MESWRMEQNKLFVNKRNVPELSGKYTRYVNKNGVLKRFIPSPLAKLTIDDNDIWYDYSELPLDLQEKLCDLTITQDELPNNVNGMIKKNNIIDSQEVKIFVTPDTLLFPIVGNLLPTDGTYAYTVVMENDKLRIKPIDVCWNCHWSELFTGQSDYGNNVFCLVSELSKEQMVQFLDDIIRLRDVPEFLGWNLEQNDKRL